MRVGIHTRLTAKSLPPAELACLIEGLGFESLFLPEHTHIPPELLDPFVALASAASVTQRLLLGTGVCLVGYHDPIILAKTVATLDVVSRGRLLFGVGSGSRAEEAQAHGVDPARRWEAAEARLSEMLALWRSNGEVRPPLLVGGEGRRSLALADSLGAAWFPHHRLSLPGQLPFCWLPVTVLGPPPERSWIERYREAGAFRVVLELPFVGDEREAMTELEKLARAAAA